MVYNPGFSFCSFNVGESGYLELKDPSKFDESRNARINECFNNLFKNKPVDAIALQDITQAKTELACLKEQGYHVVEGDPSYDSIYRTAIALNPDKFKDFENKSFHKHLIVSIVTATEIATGKKIAFISFEADDFNYEHKTSKKHADSFNHEIKNALDEINKRCEDCDVKLIGADMNISPEIYNERFKLFEKAGFQLHRTNKNTRHVEIFPESDEKSGKPITHHVKKQDIEADFVFVSDAPKKGYSGKKQLKIDMLSSLADPATGKRINPAKDVEGMPFNHVPVLAMVRTVELVRNYSHAPLADREKK